MRQIILDTETTGLEWRKGNRVVEIGCVELIERRPTGRSYHQYIHPERDFEPGAQEVTGLTLDFLADKPRFGEIAGAFLDFVDGAELVIHNAQFDIGFLDYELSLLDGRGTMAARCGVLDTLLLARERFPGQRNSLDALCKRLGVDNSQRQLHGALLDAQILAEVYLALTSGQDELAFAATTGEQRAPARAPVSVPVAMDTGVRPRVLVAPEEEALHRQRVAKIAERAGVDLWGTAAADAA